MTHRTQMIVRFLLPVAALAALCPQGCAQSPAKDPAQFDVDGVRLGMSVDEAEAALRAHGFKYIAIAQQGSRLGKEPFIGAIVGMSGTEYMPPNANVPWPLGGDPGDHIAVLFTETGGKAYSINRRMAYPAAAPVPFDVLDKQAREKYGDPPPTTPELKVPPAFDQYWQFDPAGRAMAEGNYNPVWLECARQQTDANFTHGVDNVRFFHDTQGNRGDNLIYAPVPYAEKLDTPGFPSLRRGEYLVYSPSINGLRANFSVRCGVSLNINYVWAGGNGLLVDAFGVSLVDNQLAIRNLNNLIDYAKAVEAKRLEELHKKAEEQKSPF
jgi:hypothetical protein